MDWFSISQDDPELKLLGIKSLIKYVTLCSFMLIPCELPLGLRWEIVGKKKPSRGTEIVNKDLAKLLRKRKSNRTVQSHIINYLVPSEWEEFGGSNLASDCYIKVDGRYLKPAETQNIDDVIGITSSPGELPIYGKRAWCRVEWYVFALWAEMNGAKPRVRGDRMDTSAEQVQLYAVSLAGKLFPFDEVFINDEKSLPATADLSEETDRAHILCLQEEMIDVYVPTIIRNLCAGGTGVELNMANRMLSDNNMSKLLDALRQLGPNTPGLQWREIDEQDLDNANGGSSCDEEEEEEEEEEEAKERDLVKEREFVCEELAAALQTKRVFTRQELEMFNVSDLRYNSYIRAGGKYFRPQINKLILQGMFRLTAAAWREFGDFLATDSTLEELDICAAEFDAAGATAVVSALKSNKGLKVLDCSYNDTAGSEWTVELANALAKNQQIDILRATNTCLDDAGASALACMLECNTSLKELWVSGNEITSKGATALARALNTNTTLLALTVDDNPIDDDGATALAQALREDCALQTLHIGFENKRMTAVGRDALREAADEAGVDLDSDFDEVLSSTEDEDDSDADNDE